MELQNSEKLGAPLRVDLIKNGPGTLRERVMSFDDKGDPDSNQIVSASLSFHDSDLGYFLLTAVGGRPEAVTFDEPHGPYERPGLASDGEEEENPMPEMSLLNLGPARTVYQPSESFYADSSLPKFLEKNVHSRHKKMVKEEVRLSTVTLDLMTQAHRILSQETHRLGLAASDLFRRCQRLRDELSDQVNRANEVAQRIEKVAGEDADHYLESARRKQPPSLEERLEKVQSRQGELASRYEGLRKRFSTTGGRALSEKEQAWVSEVDKADKSLEPPPAENEGDETQASELWHRRKEVGHLGSIPHIVTGLTNIRWKS